MVGRRIGNYEVKSLLGEGGMGQVYLAEHPIIGRRVALKVLHPELGASKELVERFFAEARAVNAIGHPNIVEVFDLGQTPEGEWYFTMEYLLGDSLARRLDRGLLPFEQIVRIADRVASALGAAHGRGIVHRDVKPDNIFLARRTAETVVDEVPKVLDFGVAKLGGDAGIASVRTRTGALLGTPHYMSPEQCKGRREVDWRTDIYALGVVLFEMVTGRVPFQGEGLGEVFVLHMQEPPPDPRTLRPGVPDQLADTILKALAKTPEERFQSMEVLREALTGQRVRVTPIIDPLASTLHDTPPPRAPAQPAAGTTFSRTAGETLRAIVQRTPRPALVAIAGGLIGALVVVGVLSKGGRAPAPPTAPTVHATAAPPPAAPTPPPTAMPALAIVHLDSDPPGAEVRRVGDPRSLGTTPRDVEVPADGARVEFVFSKPGYRERTEAVEVRGDTRVLARLEAVPAARAPRRSTRTGSQPKKIRGLTDDL